MMYAVSGTPLQLERTVSRVAPRAPTALRSRRSFFMSFLLPLPPSPASMPRFNRSFPRRALIIVLPWRDLILVGIQNPQFANAQPIPQVGMMGQYLGQLFVPTHLPAC